MMMMIMCPCIGGTTISPGVPVNSGENVPWEYMENEVCVGAMYPSTANLKDAVKQWSTLTLHRELRVFKNSPRIYDVCSIKDDCSLRVYAYMGKWDNYIQVKEVKGHTCTLDHIDARHRNISTDFVASHMHPHIVNSPEYAPKAIIVAIEESLGTPSVTTRYTKQRRRCWSIGGVLMKHPTTIFLAC
jgi:hypothetical protein